MPGQAPARRHRGHVRTGSRVGRGEVERPGLPARGQGQRVDRVDGGRDLGVGRRQQLPAVAYVDLDPVVLARVVAGRHHQPVGRVQVAHREGQHRGRQGACQQQHPDPGPGQDPARVGREQLGPGPPVVADDHPVRRVPAGCVLAGQVPGQPGRHPPGRQPVHPHRARAHRGPDAGRAERQRTLEAGRQLGSRPAGQQPVQFGRGGRVGVGVPPGCRAGRQAVVRSCRHLPSPSRRLTWHDPIRPGAAGPWQASTAAVPLPRVGQARHGGPVHERGAGG